MGTRAGESVLGLSDGKRRPRELRWRRELLRLRGGGGASSDESSVARRGETVLRWRGMRRAMTTNRLPSSTPASTDLCRGGVWDMMMGGRLEMEVSRYI